MDRIPKIFHTTTNPLLSFSQSVLEATALYVAATKPNFAFYEAQGLDGLTALKQIMSKDWEIFTIADAKRADIGNSSRLYAKAFFEYWGFDSVTIPPYMGSDSVQPFLDYKDKLTFILCLTSNKGSLDIEEQELRDGNKVFELVLQKSIEWNVHDNVGIVVGATKPRDLKIIQDKSKNLSMLIPGIGEQGATLEDLHREGFDFLRNISLINQSRSLIYPQGNFNSISEFQLAVEQATKDVYNKIQPYFL